MKVVKLKDLELSEVYVPYAVQVTRKSSHHWSNWYIYPLEKTHKTVAGEDIRMLVLKPDLEVVIVNSNPMKKKSEAFGRSLFRKLETESELRGYYRKTFDTIFK